MTHPPVIALIMPDQGCDAPLIVWLVSWHSVKTSIEQFDYLLLNRMLSPTVLYLPVIVIVFILIDFRTWTTGYIFLVTSMVDSVGTERRRRLVAGFDGATCLFFAVF